ncbi:MAG: hypothetical protein H6828_01140 [Planctomycetes bacterium]|nr:hypothetical protein [Planctomycetota bacterium]
MKPFRFAILASLLAGIAAQAQAGQISHVSRASFSEGTPTTVPEVQRVYLPRHDAALGPLRRVELRFEGRGCSNLLAYNPTVDSLCVDACFSNDVVLCDEGGVALAWLGHSGSVRDMVVPAGCCEGLCDAWTQTFLYSFDSNLDAWTSAPGRGAVALDVCFGFGLDALECGAARTKYTAGARTQVSVTYVYREAPVAYAARDPRAHLDAGPALAARREDVALA